MLPIRPMGISSDYKALIPEHLRLRTDILSEHPVVYIPKKQKRAK